MTGLSGRPVPGLPELEARQAVPPLGRRPGPAARSPAALPPPPAARLCPGNKALTRSVLAAAEGDAGGESAWDFRVRGKSLLRANRDDMVPSRLRAPDAPAGGVHTRSSAVRARRPRTELNRAWKPPRK